MKSFNPQKNIDMSIVKFRHYPAKSFNNLMDDFFPQLPSLFLNEPATNFGQVVPVNIKQNENGYVLDVIAPGFNKEDFKIHLEKNLLTISAEKQAEEENKNEKDIRKEYKYQSFKRSFTIDEKIDTEKIEAKYEKGVLRLNLENKEEVKKPTKQITIQ
jgi:HSP20 family protein